MSIFKLLSPDSLMVNLEAESAEDVIRCLGGKLREQQFVGDDFVDATLERESKTPTGLILSGDYNAALPHVDLEYVNQSAIALATLDHEVTFQYMVDKSQAVPVRLVILLALADPHEQISALEEISILLQDPEIVAELVQAKNAEEILAIMGRLGKGR